VRLTSGKQEIILVTESGQALRFNEKLVRPMGRPAAGMRAIALKAKRPGGQHGCGRA